jgi:hypothetical protein
MRSRVLAHGAVLTILGVSLSAASVRVEGRYVDLHFGQQGLHDSPEETQVAFSAVFDHDEMRITLTYGVPDVLLRYGIAPNVTTNTMYLSRRAFVPSIMPNPLGSSVVFSRPEYPWDLGNTGTGADICVFLLIRCKELFAIPGGVRRLAAPWTTIGEPLSLVTECDYRYHGEGPNDFQFSAAVYVSHQLMADWQQSPLLSVGFVPEQDSGHEARILRAAAQTGLMGEITATNFVTREGLVFPTFLEVKRFALYPVAAGAGRDAQRILAGIQRVVVESVAPFEGPISPLPIVGDLFVQEERLYDRRHKIALVSYRTNEVSSFGISRTAEALFYAQLADARKDVRIRLLKRLAVTLALCLLFFLPLTIYVMKRLPPRIE